jgi:hypothetical protein
MTDEYTPAIGDECWYDSWKNGADTVYLPTSNRTAYTRAGLTLLQSKALDIRSYMAADGTAARNRGLTSDYGTTVYPAPFPSG